MILRALVVPLALGGTALACADGTTMVSRQEQAIYAAPSYYGSTGSPVQSVSPYTYDTNMFVMPSWQLDSGLNPYGGLAPNGPSIYGSSLGGVSVDGETLVAEDLVGTALAGRSTHGEDVVLRVEGVERGEGDNDDVLYYSISVEDASGSTPLCGVDGDGRPIRALVLPGAWDHEVGRPGQGGWLDPSDGSFFFACRGSSVAKCFEMGFKPWLLNVHGNRVTSLHQACVRALRADYCGDGRSWTEAGIELSVWSDAGGSPADPGTHRFEAVWGHDGAHCVEALRSPPSADGEGPGCVKIAERCLEKNMNKNILFTSFASESAPAKSISDLAPEASGAVFHSTKNK